VVLSQDKQTWVAAGWAKAGGFGKGSLRTSCMIRVDTIIYICVQLLPHYDQRALKPGTVHGGDV